jgi:hypothetical protein
MVISDWYNDKKHVVNEISEEGAIFEGWQYSYDYSVIFLTYSFGSDQIINCTD